MLYTVMKEVNNFFEIRGKARDSVFTIEGGSISLDFLQEGQYFRIKGSVFNDGVFKYGDGNLKDETFEGTIYPLAVPEAFLEVVGEIESFQEKYADVSPYASESFGSYSRSVVMGSDGSPLTWKDAFRGKLRMWRKI